MKLTINEDEVIFEPETKHEELALDRLKDARSVTVRSTDGWSDSDKRASFIWEKDNWST